MAQTGNPYHAPKAAVTEAADETQPVRAFSVSGRIGRVRYIAYGIGFYLLISLIFVILSAVMGAVGAVGGVAVAAVLMWGALLVISFMLTIQRCHDFDTSGWLSLLVLVPLANLVFWFIPGTSGPNRYGPPTPPNGAAVIVLACAVPLVLFLGGILAAIALPAYQDYTHRARVSEVILSATPWRTAVTEHYMSHQKLPSSAADLKDSGLPLQTQGKHGTVTLGENGLLTLTMTSPSASIADKTIVIRPRIEAGALQWDCTGGTLPPKYRPANCRAR